MWILESTGSTFGGKRLWLRPGKLYLLGRTSSQPGQYAITHATISRRHATIKVDPVAEGDAQNLATRSCITIEDLNSSKGTVVNGRSIKGSQHVCTEQSVEFQMGKCQDVFRISWNPVVLTFSFTKKEMQKDPLATLRAQLEQLDIKFLTEYKVNSTTHVVSKKRNTAKGLQALINGKYIITNSFIDSVVAAAAVSDDQEPGEGSALETDFDANWPNPLDHLPPRGSEASNSAAIAYAPNLDRLTVFKGYTFIFYDDDQYNNLLAPITNGSGKAVMQDITAHQTLVDDFVRFVKSIAGEKGVGSFDDGSEGRGVVVVKYHPKEGDPAFPWYAEFITSVSLRLDHRMIEQNEFLEAILTNDASILRRPLPVDPAEPETATRRSTRQRSATPNLSQPVPTQGATSQAPDMQSQSRRSRVRRPATKRFTGFDDDDDDSDTTAWAPPVHVPEIPQSIHEEPEGAQEDGMFMPDAPVAASSQDAGLPPRRSARKRGASPLQREPDMMEDIAPTAAGIKRRRVASGMDPIPADPEQPEPTSSQLETPEVVTVKKEKREIDILEVARKRREEQEARARAEEQDLANLPEDVDLAEIRRLNIVEEMEVRQPAGTRTRDQDVEDGRWDPRWNGRKNFKRFRARDQVVGRPVQRVIISLTEAKTKEFGIGDDYWLEDPGPSKQSGASTTQTSQSQTRARASDEAPAVAKAAQTRPTSSNTSRRAARQVIPDDDSEDGNPEDDSLVSALFVDQDSSARPSRSSRATQPRSTRSQNLAPSTDGMRSSRSQASGQRNTQAQNKRAASPAAEQPAKRARPARPIVVPDSDSEDEGRFRFGRRR